MKSIKLLQLLIIFALLIIASCTKTKLTPDAISGKPSFLAASPQPNGISDPVYTPMDDDSIERITVLGSQEPNPYLIPNMQQAYLALGYNPNMATVTNLYIRFKPTVDQVAALDSIMDLQGLDLFDTPMDYDVTYEGDYYQDPTIPDSLPTWQYAVVPPNFVFPSGINYQILAQIHIPSDAYTAVETEAESIAGGSGGGNNSLVANGTAQPNSTTCVQGYHKDPDTGQCVPDNCPPGYKWNGTTCALVTCPSGEYFNGTSCVPYNTTPPTQAPDAQIPQGAITVFDTQLNMEVPIKTARMVARRWFKIQRTYTDNSGNFVFTKHFKHKVRVIVKFRNDYASVRGMRGLRLWQMLFPVKKELGIYSSDKTSITYHADLKQTFITLLGMTIDVTSSNKSTRFWAAATTLNTVQEYRNFATNQNIGQPPTGLKILLSNYGKGGGATPMFAKRALNDLPAEYFTIILSPPVTIASQILLVLKHQVDIAGSYDFRDKATGKLDGFPYLRSDAMKELFFHELTHAGHYNALSNLWYTTFVNDEIYEIGANLSSGFSPYGNGSNSQSPLIALGESWAYHIGQYLTDKQYGNNSDPDNEQTILYYNGAIMGLSSHLIALENYDPNLLNYPFDWIPKGVYYDMIDTRNENMPIADAVSGFTNQQLFNAFSSSIVTLTAYKQNLISQNPNNPTVGQVNNLFSQYGY